MKTMLFNPYSGKLRHPSDIASDPAGVLMIDPDEPLRPAREPSEDAKDAALSFARAALLEMAKACRACKDGPEDDACCRFVQWEAIKTIDALASIGQSAKEKQS